MKKKLVSLLSLILAVVMVFPVTVFADETAKTLYYNATTENGQKTYQIPYEGETAVASWESKDTSIVTVSNTGLVTAVGAGSTFVIAYDADYNQLAKQEFTVVSRTLNGITVKTNPTTMDYHSGDVFDPTGMVIEATYNNGDVESISSGFEYTTTPLNTTNDTITIKYGDKTVTLDVNVTELLVTKVEVVNPTVNYTEGDKISGVQVKVTYNDGTFETIYGGYSVNPGAELKTTDKSYTVTYRGITSEPVGITVKAKPTSGDGTGSGSGTGNEDVYKATVTDGTPDIKSYKVNEKFNAKGITIKITKGTETVATLSDDILSQYINYTFVTADIGKTEKTFEFNYNEQLKITMKVSGLTIAADTDDRELEEITGIRMNEDEYYVGHKFTLDDIKEITVEFDGENRDRDIDGEDLEKYEFAKSSNGFVLEILNANGNRKSSSYRQLIQDSDVQTDDDDSSKKFIEMRLYYKDEDAKTQYLEFTVEIGEPDISFYYDNKLRATYKDLEDALEYTLDNDSDWDDDFDLDDVRDSKSITLKLGKDFTISSSYDKYSPEHNIIIDLNGYDLVFYSDTIVIDEDDEKYTVTITNSSKTEATFKYSDKNITLTLGEDDKIEFEYDEDADDDYLPGIMTVNVTIGANGKVTASPSISSGKVTVGMGSDVKFTITPNSGYAVDTVKVDSKTVAVTNNSNYSVSSTGVVTYTLADVEDDTKVEVTFKEVKAVWNSPFTDVKSTSSYYEAVEFVYTHELFNGMTNTTFGPNVNMNRAMFVTVLGRLSGLDLDEAEDEYGTKSSFPDITVTSDTKWYVPYIEWAVENGIVIGRDDGTFDPYAYITKQEMYVMMYRYAVYVEHKQINLNGVNLTASDRGDVKDWAIDEVKYAHQQEYLVLSGTKIEPEKYAVRWELAMLLQKFSTNVLGWAD